MAIHSRVSLKTIQHGIDKLEDFEVASMSGKNYSKWENVPRGILPSNISTDYNKMGHLPVYVIFSYVTPIAFVFKNNRENWIIPDIRYSVTTTNHQGIVSVASKHKGFYDR